MINNKNSMNNIPRSSMNGNISGGNTNANTSIASGDSTDGPMVFNWDSNYKNNHIDLVKKQTERQLQVLSNTFEGRVNEMRDSTGKRIVNLTNEKIWFKDYVALIFSIGCIFNESDNIKLNEIMKCFNNDGETGFLMNYKKVLNYDDRLIKAIEEKMEIGNGNYHVCLITIVTTNNKEILENSPERQYSISGVINKYCEWKDIFAYMNQIVARYGVITEQEIHHDERLSWEMGQEGMATKTVRHSEVESNFDIDIDPEDESQIKLETELEFMKEKEEHFNTRQRNTKMMREGEGYNPYRNRFTKNGSLYTRIQRDDNCGISDYTPIDDHKGVQLRMNESQMPPNRVSDEYQLFNDSDSYVNGKNITGVASSAAREQIPRFQQITRGNKGRTPTNNPLEAIKRTASGQ